jgi:hypothetical protein
MSVEDEIVAWLTKKLDPERLDDLAQATDEALDELAEVVRSVLADIASEEPELLASLSPAEIADAIQQVVESKIA